ncbi:flagellin [Carnobacterium iners]|uniref:Flagellin n=1 Tax=Carnobacterium iners TaxID=1073423 RepID=A0A1X7N298_9LACT|nr:flagellin [Carnobacterium iners]SEK21507.1 flagellin [Carnobacterium iners]SMH30563.1 flagellin [Carnobacterium iners]
MRINTNTAAMNTYSNLTSANASKSNSLAKLSSGLRINKAGDDAAGLAISEKMKNQVSGMTQASRNAQDGISLIQTAEGALSETHSILNRMRDLTVQSSNDTNTIDDKKAIQSEINSLTSEIDRIASDTEFNTKGLMNGGEITSGSITDAKLDYTALTSAYATTGATGVTFTSGADTAPTLEKISKSDLNKTVDSYNLKNDISIDDTDGTVGGSGGVDLAELTKIYDAVAGNTTPTTAFADTSAAKTALAALTTTQKTDINEKYNTSKDISVSDIKEAKTTKFSFQIGANAGQKIDVEIANLSKKGLELTDLDVVNGDTDKILEKLDEAIGTVSSQRANLGAVQNRLDHTVSNLATTKENLSEANSRITDVDMAEEMMSFTKSNILSQASTSMLAQANQMPQSVLSLLQ